MGERESWAPHTSYWQRGPVGGYCKGLKSTQIHPKVDLISFAFWTVLTWFIIWLRNSHMSDGVMSNFAWCFLPDTFCVKNKRLHFLFAVSPPSPWPIIFPKITSLIHWKDFCGSKYVFNVLWLTNLKIGMLLGSRPGWSCLSLLCLIFLQWKIMGMRLIGMKE